MKKSTKKGWGALLVFPFIIFSCFILKKKVQRKDEKFSQNTTDD